MEGDEVVWDQQEAVHYMKSGIFLIFASKTVKTIILGDSLEQRYVIHTIMK